MNSSILTEINSALSRKEIESLRKEINEALDDREKVISLCEDAMQIKGRSFGCIKENMDNIIPGLYGNKQAQSVIDKYIKAISGDKKLKAVYGLYESLDGLRSDGNVADLIKEWRSKNDKITKEDLYENIDKLERIVMEAFILSNKKASDLIPEEAEKYYRAVESAALREDRGSSNLQEFFNNVDIVKEAVKRKNEGRSEKDSLSVICNEGGDIDKDKERALFEILDLDKRKDLYEKAKGLCLSSIKGAEKSATEKGDEKSAEKLRTFSEQVEKKEFEENTAYSDIDHFRELDNCLK